MAWRGNEVGYMRYNERLARNRTYALMVSSFHAQSPGHMSLNR